MLKKLKLAINNILGLAIICGLIYIFYELVLFVLNLFSKINPTVGAGMIAATATVIVSVISVLVAKHLEQKATLLKEHRERKTPVYEEMVKLIFRIAFSEKIGLPKLTEQELLEKVATFTENLVVWGSTDLLLAWAKFRRFSIENAGTGNHILFEVENLLLAIRKDLGHSNKGVPRGKILSLFVNDIDDFI